MTASTSIRTIRHRGSPGTPRCTCSLGGLGSPPCRSRRRCSWRRLVNAVAACNLGCALRRRQLNSRRGGRALGEHLLALGYRFWLVFWHQLLNDLIDSEARGLLAGGNSLKLSS